MHSTDGELSFGKYALKISFANPFLIWAYFFLPKLRYIVKMHSTDGEYGDISSGVSSLELQKNSIEVTINSIEFWIFLES